MEEADSNLEAVLPPDDESGPVDIGPVPELTPKGTEAEGELAAIVEPVLSTGAVYSEWTWIVSCRSTQSLDRFSSKTLMFRPDLRPFCSKGVMCRRKHEEVHDALYIHTPKPRDTSRTAMVNRRHPLRRAPRIPHVPEAWVIGRKSRAAKDLALEGLPENAVVVLFVHGFSEPFPRIVAYLNHLGKHEWADERLSSQPVHKIGFVWPSASANYFSARFAAERAARILRRTMEMLSHRNNRIILLCHSMGCRVGCHALFDWKGYAIEHTFLIGAGIAADSLNKRAQFDARRLSTKKVSVVYSRNDRTLTDNFPFAELPPGLWNLRPFAATQALGYRGCAPGHRDDKVDQVDCSDQVLGHSTHIYLKSPKAKARLAHVVQATTAAPTLAKL